MAMLGSSISTTSASTGLTTSFLNALIRDSINAQRQPINALNTQKDQLNLKKAIYSDLKTKLTTFKSVIEDLTIDHSDTVLDNIIATSSDSSALTANATSSAAKGTYIISIANLAKVHKVRSDQQSSSSESLNLSGTFTLNGAEVNIEATNSLRDIMNAINRSEYIEGKEVKATIVDNHLVIESVSTGTSNQMIVSDDTDGILSSLGILMEGSFKNTIQTAQDASFAVNSIQITRGSNTGLDNIIEGVTLDLLKADQDNEIKLIIQPDYTGIRMKFEAFITNFNSLISYITSKAKVTVDQNSKTYVRGSLTGETIFSRLKMSLVSALRTSIASASEGDPQYLTDVGLKFGVGLNVSLNSGEFISAMESNLNGVAQLFDNVMKQFLSVLEPFTTSKSSSNTLELYTKSINSKISNINTRIKNMEAGLKKKEEMLVKQYSAIYIQNIEFTSQQYSIFNSYYTTKI